MRPVVRRLLIGIPVLVVLALAGIALFLVLRLRSSLPRLTGELVVAGLGETVEIERDQLGVPRVTAANERDAAFALGFLHAQDRFFQMDLQRRRAAGELAALVGERALDLDKRTRVHRFRARAERAVGAATAEQRAIVDAYAAGVNAGLADLGGAPWEYLALGVDPEPWQPADAMVTLYSMYLVLQGEDHRRELAIAAVERALPAELVAFLYPPGTEWDAPMVGEPVGSPWPPAATVVDPRSTFPVPLSRTERRLEAERVLPGSNNLAVAGSRSATGLPIVAGDMHLGLGVPTLWYRAELHLRDQGRRLVGPSLPGTPLLVSGSNGSIAWTYTNAYGDWNDLVVVEEVPGGYRTPDGEEPYSVSEELIEVAGGPSATLEVRETRWGPVVDEDAELRPLVRRWVAYDLEGANLGVLGLWRASSVAEALERAPEVGIPAQNLVVADRHGSIAWTVVSAIPRRFGHDGRLPQSWADGTKGWDGWIGSERPRVVDPADGRLWSANARVVSGDELAMLGDSGYDLGARAGQIRDGLGRLEQATPRDLLAIELDDRALFLARWQELLLRVTEGAAGQRAEARRLVEQWGGRAAIDSVGYRLVRAFRYQLEDELYSWLTGPVRELVPEFSWRELGQREGALWRMVSERPAHLLPPTYATWDELLLDALDASIEELTKDGRALGQATWGDRNRIRLAHPLSAAVPFGPRFLDFAERQLPGDWNMPRVQSPTFGASQRMVVTPGREEEGIFQLPGGQSANPWSPFYRAGLEAWQDGQPTPLLAGPAQHRLVLQPVGRDGG